MKVTGAKIYRLEIDGRRPIVVRLETSEGIDGIGDAAVAYGSGSGAAAELIRELVEKYVLGRDPARIEAVWHEMYDNSFWAKGGGSILLPAMSAIETALWDIKGKALGVPIYELLGGTFRETVWVYANGWSFRCRTLKQLAHEAEAVVKLGYTALKLYPLARPTEPHGMLRHAALRTIDRDTEKWAVASVAAVRDAVGPDVEVMVDMSACLTPDVAIRLGRELEPYRLYFYEEPVDPFDVESMKKVAEHVAIPIAAGERLYTRYGFRRVLEQRAVDIIQPDVGAAGGILETKYIMAMAEMHSARVQLHTCSSPVGTAAALQLDACMSNLAIQETYPFRPDEHWAIVDHAPELDIKDSCMPIPTRPGLGVDLNPKMVDQFLWADVR